MKTQSCKAKGRKLQQRVRDLILENFEDLEQDDVRSTSMGAGGEDVLLSPKARKYFPFSIECKNQESLGIWKALKQATDNSGKYTPLLIFKRNHSKTYACLEFDDLMKLVKNQKKEG